MRVLLKRITVLLFVVMTFTMLFTVEAQAASNGKEKAEAKKPAQSISAVSGDLSAKKQTKAQIVERWLALETVQDMYKTEPSVSAPYKLGKLTDAYLDTTEDHLNFLRYIAHLPAVQHKAQLNESAQYASVVNAANGYMSHFPEQPAGMSKDFWKKGYDASSSSNLAYYSESDVLWSSMQQYMDDLGAHNADSLGHRRWLLNPALKYVGFGQAGNYSATKIFDESNSEWNNYDYVAWPASGYFPNAMFGKDVAWSVVLNDSKYTIPSDKKVKITLTRESDGKKWTFNKQISGVDHHEYCTIDHTRYGCNPTAIIFRPNLGKTEKYQGKYTVNISGIATKNGKAVTLKYTVDFFDLAKYAPKFEIVTQPKDVCSFPGKASVSVKATGMQLKYQWYVREPGSNQFTKTNNATPTYTCTMNTKSDGRQVYCVVSDYSGSYKITDIVTLHTAKITKQPKTAVVKNGAAAKVSVKATGDGLTYTWYIKDKGAKKYTKSSAKSSAYTVTMNSAKKDRKLYCVVKDKYGNKVQTDAVELRMAATVTTQPKTVTVANGKSAKVTVKAVGDGLTYTWYVKDKNAKKYAKSSVTSASYSATMSSKTKDRQLYCIVKDKYGNKVQTNTVSLRMAAETAITTQPKNVTVAKGKTAKVTLKASGEGLTYTWYYKDKGAAKFKKTTSVKGATYSVAMNAARNGRQIYCVVKDKSGKTVKSNTVTLKMK